MSRVDRGALQQACIHRRFDMRLRFGSVKWVGDTIVAFSDGVWVVRVDIPTTEDISKCK